MVEQAVPGQQKSCLATLGTWTAPAAELPRTSVGCCHTTNRRSRQQSSTCFTLYVPDQVEKVYLLVRGKKHLTAAQRVENMLCLPLFHLLHDDARSGKRNVFTKVQAVEGDLALPGLGLSAEDAAAVRNEVTVIIHCAADIELDAPIQKTLK
eukprot:GHUV01009327.1.p1 GENE.GHUV01009327.1~~GHUV01009327.1.p1  ORF type:complete len:152 (+),score=32.95 GHUV01009327.1:212-667(+)